MDQKDIRTLRLLEAIDNGHSPSQRDLARELNVSLGLVNSFIKRLAGKGYFKISTIPKNRVRYILTPNGIAEKTRLTYAYIRHSFQFYSEARKKLNERFKQLEKEGALRIVLYGANDFAEIAFISCQGTSITTIAVVDDQKAGERFFDTDVKAPSELKNMDFDKILVTAIHNPVDAIGKIIAGGIGKEKILSFYW